MDNPFLKKLLIFLMLGLLAVSAFFIRFENFKNSQDRTIDEMVYYRMALQVRENFFDYNTVAYGKELASTGRELPDYFFAPLFKHPPVFTYLIVFFMNFFGTNFFTAGMVPVFLSALMIPLIYLLGATAYNRFVGIIAALFLWLDPVNIISSQKIWMDTPIAFFILLCAVFFSLGLKYNNGWYFILSGISSGLAANTKYTGMLITLAVLLFTITYRRELFKNKMFCLSLIIPALSLIPWLLWNYYIYGINSIKNHDELKQVFHLLSKHSYLLIPIIIIVAAAFFLIKKMRDNINEEIESDSKEDQPGDNKLIRYVSIGVIILFFGVFLRKYLLNSLDINYLPFVTWYQGAFHNEPPVFYFGRLMEFFFVYAFAYVSILLFQPHENEQNAFIRITSVLIIVFFIAWGNFQSRYVLSATPFLLVLSASMIFKFFQYSSCIKNSFINRLINVGLILIVTYSIFKVCNLNILLSFPNDMCYF